MSGRTSPGGIDAVVDESVELLQRFEFTEYEARSFVALSRIGTGTAKEVAEVADIPQARVYDCMETLRDRGLVDIQQSTPRRFRASGPEEAVGTLDRQYASHLDRLRELFPRLESPAREEESVDVWVMEGSMEVGERRPLRCLFRLDGDGFPTDPPRLNQRVDLRGSRRNDQSLEVGELFGKPKQIRRMGRLSTQQNSNQSRRTFQQIPRRPMAFELPDLPYDYDALEPHIDAQTMRIHHDKHHAGYTRKLNNALEGYDDLQERSIEELLAGLDTLPTDVQTPVRQNGGGFYNHRLFWDIMSPDGGGTPSGDLADAIHDAFGSYEDFKDAFADAATGQFGSGWGWLVAQPNGELSVTSTPNQDNPLLDGHTPILGVDVWEHAYYLNYQNERGTYVDEWWDVVDWSTVGDNYDEVVTA